VRQRNQRTWRQVLRYGKYSLFLGGDMKAVVVLIFTVLLAGCAGTQNTSADSLRTKDTLRLSETLPMTVHQVAASLYKWQHNCRPLPVFLVDPADPNSAMILFSMPGWSRVSTGAVADFHQAGASTEMKYFSYYSTWDKFGEELKRAILDPSRCE
jgi:hypothetical protein